MMDTETLTDRELDALVAEKVFGGPQHNVQWYWWKSSTPSLDIDPPLYAGPHFSTDIAAAWQIVEHFPIVYVRRSTSYAEEYEATIYTKTGPGHYGEATTAPLAICRAALKAIE